MYLEKNVRIFHFKLWLWKITNRSEIDFEMRVDWDIPLTKAIIFRTYQKDKKRTKIKDFDRTIMSNEQV